MIPQVDTGSGERPISATRYKIYGEREFTWNKVRQQNRNPLLAMGIGADGMKTGYTKEAGYGLVGSAVNNNLRLILVAGLAGSLVLAVAAAVGKDLVSNRIFDRWQVERQLGLSVLGSLGNV